MDNNPRLRTAYSQTETVVSEETGEILSQNHKDFTYVTKDKEEFFMFYTKLLSIFEVELTLPEVKVMCYLLRNYGAGVSIAINVSLKQEIGESTKLKLQTVSNALSSLNKKGLVYLKSRGLYKVNPAYAFKGSQGKRSMAIQVMLEEECQDCLGRI